MKNKKKEKNKTRIAASGNLINYPRDIDTVTTGMLLVKLLFNSIVSIPCTSFITMDL